MDGEHGLQALHDRVMELEIKASYSEDLLEQLNLTIYRQQQQIDALLTELRDRGVTVSCDTLWRFLREAGISFKKNRVRQRAGSA